MSKIHADIKIKGIVQGVGFRPFVHKLAERLSLAGFVRNTRHGAEISVEGSRFAVDAFVVELRENPPRLAFIESVCAEKSDTMFGYRSFDIAKSEPESARRTLISPDVAVCDDCLREMFDETDRRHKYPFINCTNCGPRFTIIKDIPYDRQNTTMADFKMCKSCEEEYGDIGDRRYHAQPDCCGECGPHLTFYDANGKMLGGDPIALAKEYIRSGKIVAVKGVGGIHLACDCDNTGAVNAMRKRKHRDEKPFAIMCRDIEIAKRYAEISDEEKKLLASHRRPIVLLKKHDRCGLLHISENGYVGIMLPYTPMHHLLLSGDTESVVMTSANISDLPIIYKNAEAFTSLSGIADGFLMNNREIHVRCDDSLMWVYRGREYFARRSRGYVPHPIVTDEIFSQILACGAEQKASFALSCENHIFPSQHIGDLKNIETLESYEDQIKHFENIFDIKPQCIVCDMHPDYMSTAYAEERAFREGLCICRAQHHHAHMCSCMADNGYDGKCIGIVWDGTGYGTDGNIWGAEFLVGDFSGFTRLGTIRQIRLPGGDRAIREISRCGISLLADAGVDPTEIFGQDADKTARVLDAGMNCPHATSMGRLFDGVAAIIGISHTASYEGQGATLLEAEADEVCDTIYSYSVEKSDGMYVFDYRDMIREIVKDKASDVPAGEIAAAFMNTLVEFAQDVAVKISADTGIKTVALSGGTFQNMYLLKRLDEKLSSLGFCVLTHNRVSTNDEGISLGQIMIAQRGGQ